MKDYVKKYCVGCGLCESLNKAKCSTDENGFRYPVSGDEEWLCKVCPSAGKQQEVMDFNNIWGRTVNVCYGWSKNAMVRQTASSGGTLTEFAAWMLEKNYADVVLHICFDSADPTKTICCHSVNREEMISRCGSRYAISHPLEMFTDIDKNKKYVFIGKPCDVVTLNNYLKLDKSLRDCIVLTMSFFCAGLPSTALWN